MTQIRIPQRIRLTLERDAQMLSVVEANFAEWLPLFSGGMPLFPEYTDHGLPHLEGVLATADSLAADSAWQVLSAGDAAVLSLAVLLHDCAMHLREDGFLALVTSSWRSPIVDGFADEA